MSNPPAAPIENNDHLITSNDRNHPANLIPELCAKFWHLGWVTGTGGGASIRKDDLVYLAPSGVQKELITPQDIYVLSLSAQKNPLQRIYLRSPPLYKPSQCTPLFLSAFTKRDARCCIHTHSHWAVMVTLILESSPPPVSRELHDRMARREQELELEGVEDGGGEENEGKVDREMWADGGKGKVFEINWLEQIKAFGRGWGYPSSVAPSSSTIASTTAATESSIPNHEVQAQNKGQARHLEKLPGSLTYSSTLRIPMIRNTHHEEDLRARLEEAMDTFPETYAVLVQRHGVYVWGESMERAKAMAESLDYLLRLAVEMRGIGVPWLKDVEVV